MVCAPVAQVRTAYKLITEAYSFATTGDLASLATVFRLNHNANAALIAEISGILLQSNSDTEALQRLRRLVPKEFKAYVTLFDAVAAFDSSGRHRREFYDEVLTLERNFPGYESYTRLEDCPPEVLDLLGYARPVASIVRGSLSGVNSGETYAIASVVPLKNTHAFRHPLVRRADKRYTTWGDTIYEMPDWLMAKWEWEYNTDVFATMNDVYAAFSANDQVYMRNSPWYDAQVEEQWQQLLAWQRAESEKVRNTEFFAPSPKLDPDYNIYARRNYGPYIYLHCDPETSKPGDIIACFDVDGPGVDRGFVDALNEAAAISRASPPLGALAESRLDLWPYPGYYTYLHNNYYAKD